MVDIYERALDRQKKKEDIDLSKYATKDEVADLMHLSGIGLDEFVVFQDPKAVC